MTHLFAVTSTIAKSRVQVCMRTSFTFLTRAFFKNAKLTQCIMFIALYQSIGRWLVPGYPHGDGDCAAPGCDCGKVPCGFYVWNHSSTSLPQTRTHQPHQADIQNSSHSLGTCLFGFRHNGGKKSNFSRLVYQQLRLGYGGRFWQCFWIFVSALGLVFLARKFLHVWPLTVCCLAQFG